MTLPVDNPWILFDLDGTILESGHYPEYGPPIEGAAAGMQAIKKLGFKIGIWTQRMAIADTAGKYQNLYGVARAIAAHLGDCNIPFDYIFPMVKPTYIVAFVDDRAIRFDRHSGGWHGVYEKIIDILVDADVPVIGDKRPYLERLVM